MARLPRSCMLCPRGVELTTLKVPDRFRADGAIWPSDVLILAPSGRVGLSDVPVLRGGDEFTTSNEPRSGCVLQRVVVGQFRAHTR